LNIPGTIAPPPPDTDIYKLILDIKKIDPKKYYFNKNSKTEKIPILNEYFDSNGGKKLADFKLIEKYKNEFTDDEIRLLWTIRKDKKIPSNPYLCRLIKNKLQELELLDQDV
jgi:hypothetical protein